MVFQANDVVFCGRILMFLAHFFPLTERSGFPSFSSFYDVSFAHAHKISIFIVSSLCCFQLLIWREFSTHQMKQSMRKMLQKVWWGPLFSLQNMASVVICLPLTLEHLFSWSVIAHILWFLRSFSWFQLLQNLLEFTGLLCCLPSIIITIMIDFCYNLCSGKVGNWLTVNYKGIQTAR